MLSAINLSLNERKIEAHYVSLNYAVWDDEARVMTIANSGLPQPIHVRQGRVKTIDARGLPAGLFPKAEYEEVTLHPEPGDCFVFFTDGITDASDERGRMLGRSRLEEVVAANAQGSPQQLVNAVFDAATHHAGGAEAFDDQTVVALKVGPCTKRKTTA